MCDDPRNPHRLRFDPKRKDKVEVSENDRPVPGKQDRGFNTQECAAAQRTAKKEYCRHLLATVEIH